MFNVFENAFIDLLLFEILYEVKPWDLLFNILWKDLFELKTNFLKRRKQIKLNTINVVKLAQIKMTIQYNKNHKLFYLKDKVFIKMTKTDQVEYHILKSTFSLFKKMRSFIIKKQLSSLAYKLNLSTFMKIYSIISIIYLKQIKKDLYKKKIKEPISSEPGLIIINGNP